LRYVEIAVEVDAEAAERLLLELIESGLAVEQRDATTLLPPPPGRVRLLAWAAPEDARATHAAVEEALRQQAIVAEVQVSDHDEDEWREVWKQFFEPRTVGLFTIVPSWRREHPLVPGQIRLEIDPGRAFGTGGHASTRLVLEAMGRRQPPRRMLDVGCGSGILGIAAALRRPDCQVVSLDLDPEAVATTRENAIINGVAERVDARATPLEDLSGAFDLVVANIQADVLCLLAGDLTRVTNGHLMASGLLDEQADQVADVFARLDELRVIERLSDEGWTALVLERER
jgi:ribosomal protein L11 methyltransferase